MRVSRFVPTFRAWRFMRDLRRVWPYARPYWRLGAASGGLAAFGVLVSLVAPWPLAILIDTVLGTKPVPSLLEPLIGDWSSRALLIFAVVSGLVVVGLENTIIVVSEYVNTKLDQWMVLDLRSDMFRHAHRLSQEYHERTRTGAMMYRINNQARAVGGIAVAIIPLVQALATLVGMFVITYMINWKLAVLALSVVPFIYYSIGYYADKIQPRLYGVRGLEGQSLSIVQEAMSMLRVVVSFGREEHEYGRFRRQGETAVRARVGVTIRQTAFSLVVNTITAAGTALVLWFGALQVLHGNLTVGELVVVLSYVAAVYQPLQQISTTFSSLQNEFISLKNAMALLDKRPDVVDAPDAVRLRRTSGWITFQRVGFSYQGRRGTLQDISLEAKPGQRVGIVGPTGAGKSTLVNLIPRFFDPQKGRIYLDGRDLRSIGLESLRSQISIVHQDAMLFSGTIADNIRYGRLEATDEEVVEAAEAANAHDFISRLPKNYDTVLGERGAQLSGGERQRIAVARAFLKEAPILILDEPTSSIDSRTEKVILDALNRLMVGRTSFMIAHRLSTIRDADHILVLDEGRLVEQGPHDQLLSFGGLYAQLHDAQTGHTQRRGPLAAVGNGAGRHLSDESARSLAAAARLLLEIDAAALESLAERAPDSEQFRRAVEFVASLPREELALLRDLNEDVLAQDRYESVVSAARGTGS